MRQVNNGDGYMYINEDFQIRQAMWTNHQLDHKRKKEGNFFTKRRSAIRYIKKLKYDNT
jgi:hypothetical protein